MIKVKDGYAKLIGTTYSGSTDRVLLSNGGDKAVSDFAAASGVVTSLGTNGNYVTWTKNGITNNLTVPYSSISEGLKGVVSTSLPSNTLDAGYIKYYYNIVSGTEGLFNHKNNANGILSISKHNGNFLSQLGFSSDRRLYFRSANKEDINSLNWNKIAYVSEIPTVTNYYWANVKISNTSNSSTSPTFGLVNSAGLVTSNSINITGITAESAHIKFNRSSYNYITFPSDGSLAFGTDVGSANTIFRMTTNALFPQTNNSVDLGTSSMRWSNIYSIDANISGNINAGKVIIYDGTNSCLYLKTASAGAAASLSGYNTGGQYGVDVVLHSGSAMVLGAGESAAAMYSNNIDSLRGSENLYLTADGSVKIFTNCDSIGNRKQVVHFDTSGYTYFGSYINIGGHEKNASSPTYVWGSNNSDNFLRSYQTSSLSVGTATIASYLPTKYDGNDFSNPQQYFNENIGVRVAMTRYTTIGGTRSWFDTLWINGYSGADVPNMVALTTIRNGTPRAFLSAQSNRSTTYGTYYEIISSYNIGNLSVNYAKYSGYALSLNSVNLPSSAPNTSNTAWCKFATITFNESTWCNTSGYFFFSGNESLDYNGILEYHFRSGNTATVISLAQLRWLIKSHDFASVIAVKSADNVYDFYINNCSTHSSPRIYHFSAYNNSFRWNVGSWTTTKPTAAYTASDKGRVYYSTNAGNAATATNVAWSGVTDKPLFATVATSGSYNDLTNKPTIPTVGNGTVTITQAGTTIGSFTMNQSGNTTIALSDNNTHYVTKIYAGASGTTTNTETTNPYLKVTDNNTYRNQVQFKGSGYTTVLSDDAGIITISSINTWRDITDSVSITDSTISGSATAVKTAYDKAVSAYNLANSKTSNKGTVTSVATGTGLTGGTITTSGTISLATSGVTSGSYGPKYDVTGNDGNTISVPYITVDAYGRITSISNKTYTAKNTTYTFTNKGATLAWGTTSTIATVGGVDIKVTMPSNPNTNTTYTFESGDNCFYVTPSGGSKQTVTVTPSITNNITGSGASGYLAKFDGTNTITKGPQLGSGTSAFLRNDGIWATPPNNNYYHTRLYSTGLRISSGEGVNDLYVPYATDSQDGVVTITTQTFKGQKTFANGIKIGSSSSDQSTDNTKIYFGDGSYVWIGEASEDDSMMLHCGSSDKINFQVGSIVEAYVSNAGVYSVEGFFETSDERLKNILKPVKINLDDLSKLRKIYYTWKDIKSSNKLLIGMIAQEVQKLYPELVSINKETGYLSLAYDKLSVLALEAIDVLYKDYIKLKERVDELEKLLTNRGIL